MKPPGTSAPKTTALPEKYRVWVEARQRYHLSDMQIQMARDLGLNPRKLGGLANEDQERWKAPLPEFIEELYFKRFGRREPEVVKRIEDLARKTPKRRAEEK